MLGDTPMLRETLLRLADTGTCVLDVEVLRLQPDSRIDDALRMPSMRARALLPYGPCWSSATTQRSTGSWSASRQCAEAEPGHCGLARACLERSWMFGSGHDDRRRPACAEPSRPPHERHPDRCAIHLQQSEARLPMSGAVGTGTAALCAICVDGPFQPDHSRTAQSLLPRHRTGRLLPATVELPSAELLGAATGRSVAGRGGAGRRPGRKDGRRADRLAHAALTGLLAKANQANDQPDAR